MADTKSPKNDYELGREAHLKGDLRTAKASYEKALLSDRENTEALMALASIEAQNGTLKSAEKYIRSAIDVNRYGVGFQNSLGDILVAQSRYRDAEAAYFEELRMRPDYYVSHRQLGRLMSLIKNPKRAIKHLQSALQFAPSNVEIAIELGLEFVNDKNLDDAQEVFQRAVTLDPKSDSAIANLGLVNLQLHEPDLARESFQRALTLNSKCTTALRGVGLLRMSKGDVQGAIEAFNQVLELNDREVDAVHYLANLWHRQGVWETAEKYYQWAHKLEPNDIHILNQLAELQVLRGNPVAATNSYEKALQIHPSDQTSLAGYGRLKAASGDTKLALSKLSSAVQSGQASTELLSTYARLLGAAGRGREGIALLEQRLRTRVVEDEKCSMHFTLGDLLHADSSYDLAFHNYRKANELKGARFDDAKFQQYCATIIERFGQQQLSVAARSAHHGEDLVFVTGMPRSGVRVIERYLSGVEGVHTSGSSHFVEMSAYRLSSEKNKTWPTSIECFDQEGLDRYAELFINRMRVGALPGDRLVDATWRNFLYLGLIEMLFPKARVVYCARDYRDIALSCFFTDFSSSAGMSFAYNMGDIAKFINGHRRVMAHWKDVSSLAFHTVSYERMILDFEDETDSLLRFIGLTQKVHDNQQNLEKKLPKPSSLRSTSLRRYRHYRNHLESFLETLDGPPDSAI